MTWLRANLMTAAALVLAVLLALQTWRLHTEQLAHRDLQVSVERDRQARTAAALKAVNDNTAKQETHATASQENANELLEELSRQRDAAVAGAARAERLRLDESRRAATYRAMSEAGAAACSALADRTTALDRQLAEGVGVVAELRGVVERRDAEVKALMGQIDADRALSEQR
ncbi:hypothetical protein [Comamonas sp. SCN 65-56]|uniref:hypothetical protein n=1 Tax=Comamonas sp. SCN 65-56 TaxID=1660095 RepID=UPI0025B7FA54|nr:hypothetical protein [Comamonas sp. SCN 65-56]